MYVLESVNLNIINEAKAVINGILKDMKFVNIEGVSFADVESIDFHDETDSMDSWLIFINLSKEHYASVRFYPEFQKMIVNTLYSETNIMIITIEDVKEMAIKAGV